MNKQLQWKFLVVLAAIGLSVYGIMRYGIQLGLDLKGGTSFLLRMDVSQIDITGRGQAVNQAIEIISRRVNKFGVAEPIIQQVGDDRILVQIPGLKEQDRQEARRTIQQAAYLEFLLVHADNDRLQADALSDPRFRPPLGYTNLTESTMRDGQIVLRNYYCKLKPEQGLTGKYIERAWVAYDDIGRPYISLTFNKEGAAVFGRVTAANVDRQLAIVIDGVLQSAPVIQDAILGGRAQITGNYSLVEAQRLASVLENPLEAPVAVLEERGVDPSLGKDSIQSGILASVIGAAIVLVFMPLYYRLAGVVAVLALVLNVLILLGVLAMFRFTLTLPGIAGIVLTIGMSVDANVLIYERIREELAANKGLKAAIVAGYQRAFIVIFDSNFTTILTAAILIMFGSGAVKGFGVTLTIGLIANLLTAVFFTRLVFDWLVLKGWLKSFNMMHLFKPTKIDFLSIRHPALIGAAAVVIVGAAMFVKHGGLHVGDGRVYGVDFSGGDAVTLEFKQKVDAAQVRSTLDKEGMVDTTVQYQRDAAGAHEVLYLKLAEGASEQAVAALHRDFPDAGQHVLGTERVGAVVGGETLRQAAKAVGISLLAIMIYVAFRFGEFSYGLGALVSLVLNVLMTIGLFVLVGRTFSMTAIAAVLTIIGYAINDTIVVFDRIREDKKLTGGKLSYFDLINRSINETLSRTVITGGTVILATVALLMFGGPVLNDFAYTFLVGVLIGTFCSIFIASPIVLWRHRNEGKPKAAMDKKAVAGKA